MTHTANGLPAGLLSDGTAAGHWVLDQAGSSVSLTHKAMWGLATVRGSFAELSGEGEISAAGSVTGSFRIGAASINTANPQRDTHLRSRDFFSADEHPSIVFAATGAQPGAGSGLTVTGELTAAGVSRPLSVTATVTQASPGSVTFTAEAEVDRTSFGMTWNKLGMVKGLAHVSVVAQFTRQPS